LIQIKKARTIRTNCGRNGQILSGEKKLSEQVNPMAPHHLPFFITQPNETDVLMVVMGVFLVAAQALLLPIKTLVLSGH